MAQGDVNNAMFKMVNVATQATEDEEIEKYKAKTISELMNNGRYSRHFSGKAPVGQGGLGSVFKAKYDVDKLVYAVKVFNVSKNAGAVEKALNEYRKQNSFKDHENIVRVDDCWIEDNFDKTGYLFYIRMELCRRSLKNWINIRNHVFFSDDEYKRDESEEELRDGRNFQYEQTSANMKIFLDIASGVQYLHDNHVCHRDLKPDNIMIGMDNEIKIADFGLSKYIKDMGSKNTPGVGTAFYAAPEQKRGKNPRYDSRADLYPLGIILFELLYPMHGSIFHHDPPSEAHNFIVINLLSKNELPPEFEKRYPEKSKIVKGLVAKKPNERPDTYGLLYYVQDKAWDKYLKINLPDQKRKRKRKSDGQAPVSDMIVEDNIP